MNNYLTWFALCLLLLQISCSYQKHTVSGTIIDEKGTPLTGAIVRVKATELETVSDEDGRFLLSGLPPGQSVFVTAWASGYYINGVEDIKPGESDIQIVLHAHTNKDYPNYAWLPSTHQGGSGENQGCAQCHSNQGTNLDFSLPVN